MALPNFELSKDGIEMQLATNHFGHFVFTRGLLPVLEKTKGTVRIVNLSSLAHTFPYNGGILFEGYNDPKQYIPWKAYGQSKLANILYTKELQKRLTEKGMHHM